VRTVTPKLKPKGIRQTKDLVKSEPKLPVGVSKKKEIGLISAPELKAFLKFVDLDNDFSLIKSGGKHIVEPKRDLAMKLIAYFNMSYETEVQQVREIKKGKETVTEYIVRAKVWDKAGNFGTGLASCNSSKGHTEGRENHDALAVAETRAIKRAVEGRSGAPIINQLILHFFKAFKVGPQRLEEMGIYK